MVSHGRHTQMPVSTWGGLSQANEKDLVMEIKRNRNGDAASSV